MKPKCDLCGSRHELWQGHVFKASASNNASNKVSASNNASNAGELKKPAGLDGEQLEEVGQRSGVDGPQGLRGSAPKQRWSRESYNAYQREYMRKRRAR